MIRYLAEALLAGLIALPVHAQEMSELTCQGTFMGGRAVVQGHRQYSAYNPLGDGYVRFNGSLAAEIGTARMTYEGYTKLGAYRGILQAPQGVFHISVLDATGNAGNEMIIYQGGESLGAPPTLGRLICSSR
jgi:hypothetical protein